MAKLARLGATVQVGAGIGSGIDLADAAYVGYLDPFRRADVAAAFAAAGVSAFSMEMIPRSSVAQKMDALSSQASLAGYVAVIRAAARRLGTRVEAFDTRPVVKEQVQSLGACFVEVDMPSSGQTTDGYATALTEEPLQRQREAMARHCAQADVVITTAQVFGRRAPLIVTGEMLGGMRPGSVVVDLAVESGGKVEGLRLDAETTIDGVHVLGLGSLAGAVPVDASLMYSGHLGSFVEHFWDKGAGAFRVDPADELQRACRITHAGRIVHPALHPPAT